MYALADASAAAVLIASAGLGWKKTNVGSETSFPLNFQFLLHPRYTLFVQEQTRTSLGPRAPPLASSFDLFSRRPHQQPHIPTCGLDCTLSKRSAWHYTHPTRSSLYILSRAERRALPTPRDKAERTRSRLAACSAWRICPQVDTFDRSWAVDTTPTTKVRLRSAWRHAQRGRPQHAALGASDST